MKYQKRPVVIEAFRFMLDDEAPDWFMDALSARVVTSYEDGHCDIHTLEGVMTARYGDYIIRGINGELYPCQPDIFVATYKPVDEGAQAGKGGMK